MFWCKGGNSAKNVFTYPVNRGLHKKERPCSFGNHYVYEKNRQMIKDIIYLSTGGNIFTNYYVEILAQAVSFCVIQETSITDTFKKKKLA